MAQPSFIPSCRHGRFQHNGLLLPFASHCPIEGKAQKRSWLRAPDGCYLSGGSFNRHLHDVTLLASPAYRSTPLSLRLSRCQAGFFGWR
jgi:hypothetical protein